MQRRQFIAYTLTAGAGLCGGCLFSCVNKAMASPCATTDDILGPYYRANSPARSDLTFPGIKGTGLEVSGVIKTSDCSTPVSNATFEVWQSSSEGEYDNSSQDFLYRGQFKSSVEGKYTLTTIMPGRYLNGDTYRPAHIHFKISAPNHSVLVTQLYFSGDPYLQSDPFSSQAKARMRILEAEELTSGKKKVHFDIVLNRT